MIRGVETLLARAPPDPVFVFSNHHPESLVSALAQFADIEATAVFYPIGSLPENGRAIAALAAKPNWRVLTSFVTPPLVDAIAEGAVDYLPVRASQHVDFIRTRFDADRLVLVCHVPPEDHLGEHTFGIGTPHAPLLFEDAAVRVAAVNDRLPRVRGPTVSAAEFEVSIRVDDDLPRFEEAVPDDVSRRIGEHVATLVPDGATLQFGIGSIPDAVAGALTGHQNLTAHTGIVSDGLARLIEEGVITAQADAPPARTTLLVGASDTFYEWAAATDQVVLDTSALVHNPVVMAAKTDFFAINSAIGVDLLGQVNSTTIGGKQYSAVAGLPDFVEGATLSPGGRSIIAMPSTAGADISKVVPRLDADVPTSLTQTAMDYLVTEYGVADLTGRTATERAAAIVTVAHPDYRPMLRDRLR